MTATEGLVEPPRSVVETIRAATNGDLRAREQLSAHCLPQLTAFAKARGAIDPGGVADTVMVEFLARLDRLSFETSGQMWAYLYRIARSRVIDERRATKPIEFREQDSMEELLPPSSGIEDVVTERHYVDDLLSGLTSEQREVLQMRFLDDLSIEETATRTGRTLTAVKGLQRRAIRAITAAAVLTVVVVGGLVLALTDIGRDDGIPTVSEGPPPTSGFSSDRAVIDVPAESLETDSVAVPDPAEPDTTITAEELGSADEPFSATFEFGGVDGNTGIDRFECRLDGAEFETCTSPQRYQGLAEGGHLFEVRAIDGDGTADQTPAATFWMVERPAGFPAGVDPAKLRAATDTLSCAGARGTWAELVEEGYDVMVGTEGPDLIDVSGGDRPDIVFGLGGNDTIITGDGDDRICGGDGNDTITSGDGDDRISGGGGNDSIDAGGGNDRVWAGSGTDTVNGRGGNDRLAGEGGTDLLDGSNGNDELSGGGDVDVLIGGPGRDRCEMPKLTEAASSTSTTTTTAAPSTTAATDGDPDAAPSTTTTSTTSTTATPAPDLRQPVETVDATCEQGLES